MMNPEEKIGKSLDDIMEKNRKAHKVHGSRNWLLISSNV